MPCPDMSQYYIKTYPKDQYTGIENNTLTSFPSPSRCIGIGCVNTPCGFAHTCAYRLS